MAEVETAPVTSESTSTPAPNVPGSSSAPISDEQDAANIRSELGIDPYTLQPANDESVAAGNETVETPTEGEGEGDKEKTPTDPDAAVATTPTDADEVFELTDEQFERLLRNIPEEKLLKDPRLAGKVIRTEEVDARVQTELQQRQAAATVEQETGILIQRGADAIKRSVGLAQRYSDFLIAAQTELTKAAENKEFDPKIAFDPAELAPEKMREAFRDFGTGLVLDTRRGYDNAFSTAFRSAADVVAPISKAEQEAVIAIVQEASRIENDPEQGPDAAKSHLMVESVKFLVNRAREAGKQEVRDEIAARRSTLKETLGGDPVIAAAVARVTKTQKGLPPAPVTTPSELTSTGASMDEYDAAVKSGDFDLADRISARMAQAKAGGR